MPNVSEGIPRNINNLCFNALSLGSALQQKPIDRDILRQVISDLDLGPLRKKFSLPSPAEEKITPAPTPTTEMFWAQESPSVFAEWLPKVAAALLVVLAIGGAVYGGRQWLDTPLPHTLRPGRPRHKLLAPRNRQPQRQTRLKSEHLAVARTRAAILERLSTDTASRARRFHLCDADESTRFRVLTSLG